MTKCLCCGFQTNNPKFCSCSCANLYNYRKYPRRLGRRKINEIKKDMSKKPNHICKFCSAEFYSPHKNAKFCSRLCFQRHMKKLFD